MKVHHVGIAVRDMDEGLAAARALHEVVEVVGPVFDPGQDATVCLLRLADGSALELVAGARVQGLLGRGVSYYHVCYAVPDLDEALARARRAGALLVSPPTPAPLFEGAPVAFLMTRLGLVELLGPGPART